MEDSLTAGRSPASPTTPSMVSLKDLLGDLDSGSSKNLVLDKNEQKRQFHMKQKPI